jgi:ABC-type transport system involved in cytochrome c biogenesis permease subunit
MLNWYSFEVASIVSASLWIAGLLSLYFFRKQKRITDVLIISGIATFLTYIVHLWIVLERAPMRTLGETRLWYCLFMAVTGYIIYLRWKYKWMLLFSIVMSILFICINLFKPENFDKTLMPALQSYWFVPHVIVYIFAYSLLGAATIFALKGLYNIYQNKENDNRLVEITDNIVYAGFSFLTFGLLFGALWAKEAWGHYWTWDPKETWAFITWMFYLLYIHFRKHRSEKHKTALIILAISFVILLICWFGINYLPSAQNSVHVYSN